MTDDTNLYEAELYEWITDVYGPDVADKVREDRGAFIRGTDLSTLSDAEGYLTVRGPRTQGEPAMAEWVPVRDNPAEGGYAGAIRIDRETGTVGVIDTEGEWVPVTGI